jgi:hypothetical protein
MRLIVDVVMGEYDMDGERVIRWVCASFGAKGEGRTSGQ